MVGKLTAILALTTGHGPMKTPPEATPDPQAKPKKTRTKKSKGFKGVQMKDGLRYLTANGTYIRIDNKPVEDRTVYKELTHNNSVRRRLDKMTRKVAKNTAMRAKLGF